MARLDPVQEPDRRPFGLVRPAPPEGGVSGFEEAADRYADEFTPSEDLVALARARLSWRIRRASAGSCSVCGAPLVARRVDADTCSTKCRQRKARLSRVNAL